MSTYDHGVTPQDVLAIMPAGLDQIGESTAGLNLGQVRAFIERGAGQVNNQLVRHGIAPEGLDDNSAQLARDGIISYAASQCMSRLGSPDAAIDRFVREWNAILKMLREEPQSLGSAQDGAEQSLTKSNVPTGCDRADRKRWDRRGYKY